SASTANQSMPSFRSIVRSRCGRALLVAMLSPLACRGDPARPSRIAGVTLLTREHEFYREIEDGLRKAAAAHGYKLIVTYDADAEAQQAIAIDPGNLALLADYQWADPVPRTTNDAKIGKSGWSAANNDATVVVDSTEGRVLQFTYPTGMK